MNYIKQFIRAFLGFFQGFEKVPDLKFFSQIFTKSAGGEEIRYFTLGNGSKKVLLIGCIHGNEIGTAKLVSKAVNALD